MAVDRIRYRNNLKEKMQPDAMEAAHFRSGSEYRTIRQSLGSKAFPPSRQPHALENLKGPPGSYSNVLIHNFLLHGKWSFLTRIDIGSHI